MPDQTSLQSTVWASELLGAQVLDAEGGQVARVTGLVMFPPKAVSALQVQLLEGDDPSLPSGQARLLLFDAATGYAPGMVRVSSADDVVPAFKLLTLLGRLSSIPLPQLGSCIHTPAGKHVAYLWDVQLNRFSGDLQRCRVGQTPFPVDGARGVLTSYHLCTCTSGGLVIREAEALLLRETLGLFSQTA